MIDRSEHSWYKDAVVYQLHVKAFFDANNDGIGDFAGLERKLDYIKSLGVTAVWLLPYYPSPLRDDGYDIADYRNVNPAYGKRADFRRFVRAAHDAGLRVITELVVNHTSDQHPWFQRARNAKPGSKYRDYYVWSDTDQRYLDTRIIFLDTETSNWTWDPVAQAYFWHRFYSHQPDLNFDNPRVLREVMNALHFWLEMGVDGFRLDAVPYLCEREGTNNENLPETHDILKKIRAEVDDHYPDRMLLAEANQWPEDTQEYFGAGDECHMAFHFPLMPRMYMAIAQEDRHPITDIMRQTPEIPENCQWAVFLRNHDELTLEMVTDQERDYLWNYYAVDRRMRINLGIRRRLAPLMQRDRRKIELMNGLLLSMPGTPIIYYGDEIGMGDNIYLGDRDGVRTPMQWSPDRNGGFSRADPAKLYLPPIMDPLFGYEAVNVEAQERDPSSLLSWTKRMIAVRQAHKAFGRGTLTFLYPGNRKILAYIRRYEDEIILCVVNFSHTAQAVELDLSDFKERIPVELTGRSAFPPIGELPYLLTLTGYGFYWFILTEEAALPHWHEVIPEPLPELLTLVLRNDRWADLISDREKTAIDEQVLPKFLPNQRWFAAKDERITRVRLTPIGSLGDTDGGMLIARADVDFAGGARQSYCLPLSLSWDPEVASSGSPLLPFCLAKARRGRNVGALLDASADERFGRALVDAMRRNLDIEGIDGGHLRFAGTWHLEEAGPGPDVEAKRFAKEQSNSSIMLGNQAILKLYRRLVPGLHPEVEIARFLTEEANFDRVAPLMGTLEHESESGDVTALGILQGFVQNQGDTWTHALDYLGRCLEEIQVAPPDDEILAPEDRHAAYLTLIRTLGQRTAELHRALATPTTNKAFRAEPIKAADLKSWRNGVRQQARDAYRALRGRQKHLEGEALSLVDELLDRRTQCFEIVDRLTSGGIAASKTRVHGDYHLGQVLVTQNDVLILDFEGEPARPIGERRMKTSALKDVAGMLRSFDYAAWTSMARFEEHSPDVSARAREDVGAWHELVAGEFMKAYEEHITDMPGWPMDPADAKRLIRLFSLEKALYEICYEAANRPRWLSIPVRGTLALLEDINKESKAS